jgi:beta-glucanase (GH16 family)
MAANMTLDSGNLRLVGSDVLVDGKYQGALAYTDAFYDHGFFECYCRFPAGYIWPAYFLYDSRRFFSGALKNEIDIFEWLGTNIVYVTTHIEATPPGSWQQTVSSGNLSGSYHKWGCYWDTDAIRIYLDDHLLVEITDPAQIPAVTMNIMFQWSFDGWAQPPTNVTFPAYFDVDWVKVWTKDNTHPRA